MPELNVKKIEDDLLMNLLRMCAEAVPSYMWSQYQMKDLKAGIKAAVCSIADVLIVPATYEEAVKFGPGCQTEEERSFKVDAMLAARRARIEAKPKTLEERIADVLISKGPDNPDQYRAITAELAKLAKGQQRILREIKRRIYDENSPQADSNGAHTK